MYTDNGTSNFTPDMTIISWSTVENQIINWSWAIWTACSYKSKRMNKLDEWFWLVHNQPGWWWFWCMMFVLTEGYSEQAFKHLGLWLQSGWPQIGQEMETKRTEWHEEGQDRKKVIAPENGIQSAYWFVVLGGGHFQSQTLLSSL